MWKAICNNNNLLTTTKYFSVIAIYVYCNIYDMKLKIKLNLNKKIITKKKLCYDVFQRLDAQSGK